MASAVNPPVTYYSFFLRSLLETVRLNIGECVAAAYRKLTIDSARQILMFSNNEVGILRFVFRNIFMQSIVLEFLGNSVFYQDLLFKLDHQW